MSWELKAIHTSERTMKMLEENPFLQETTIGVYVEVAKVQSHVQFQF